MQRFSEYRFPAVLAIVLVVGGTIPYAYGYLNACPGSRFMGLIGRDVPGGNMYLSYVKQSEDGANLFANRMTPEDLPRSYVNAEWWLFGRVIRWTGLSMISVFHIGRVISVVLFMFSAYFLISQCLDTVFQRRFALVLMAFGSGFGWLPLLVSKLFNFTCPYFYDIDGVTPFGYLISRPHATRLHAFAMLTFAFLLAGERSGKRGFFILSGLCALARANMRPYGIPETFLIFFLFAALLCLKERRFSFVRVKNYATAAAFPLVQVLYYVRLMYSGGLGPVLAGVDAKPPSFLNYIIWLGPPFLLIFLGFEGFTRLRQMKPSSLMLVLWIVLSFLISESYPYLRWGFEACLALFLAPPILSTAGPLNAIHRAVMNSSLASRVIPAWVSADAFKRVAASMFIAFCSLSSVIVYGRMFTRLRNCPPPYYVSDDLYDALVWLDQNTEPERVVLACPETGTYVPRIAGNKTFTGHYCFTIDFDEKNRLADRFFARRGDEGFKRRLIGGYHIRYVLFGPHERRPAGTVPSEHDWLKQVYSRGDVAIYEVLLGNAHEDTAREGNGREESWLSGLAQPDNAATIGSIWRLRPNRSSASRAPLA